MTRTRWLAATLSACLLAVGAVAGAADAPDRRDGLVQIKPKRMDMLHVLPGADFRDDWTKGPEAQVTLQLDRTCRQCTA